MIKTENIFHFQLRLMKSIRDSILEDKFPEFIRNFMNKIFPEKDFPKWVTDALASVNVTL